MSTVLTLTPIVVAILGLACAFLFLVMFVGSQDQVRRLLDDRALLLSRNAQLARQLAASRAESRAVVVPLFGDRGDAS